MYGMTPMGVFFTAIFPLEIKEQALCQQLQVVPKLRPGASAPGRRQPGLGRLSNKHFDKHFCRRPAQKF